MTTASLRQPDSRRTTKGTRLCLESLEDRSLLNGLSFAPVEIVSHPYDIGGLTVGDFNRDGIPDLAASHNIGTYPNNPSRLAIFLGTGGGSFGPATVLDPGAGCYVGTGLESADFDNDGILDLAMTHGGSNALCFGNKVTSHHGNGNGSFTAPVTPFETGGSIDIFAVGDFNRDGNLDLAIPANDTRSIHVHLGQGNGQFLPGPVTPLGAEFSYGYNAVADFNGDGQLDFIMPLRGNQVRLFTGSGNGAFTSSTQLTVPGAVGIVAGDFNEDGRPDLAVTSLTQGQVYVFLNTGGGNFSSPVIIPVGPEPQALDTADFNADGHMDLAIGGTAGRTTVTVLLGDGSGGFGNPSTLTAGPGPGYHRLRAADLNGDGLPDLVASSHGPQPGISVLINTTPVLTATGTSLTATANQRFAAVVSSFIDHGTPGTATDYVAYLDWGDNTNLGTGGIERTGPNTFDVAGSHRYATAGEYWVTITIYDARTWDRFAIAYTYVNVEAGRAPDGPGGGQGLGDVIAALEPDDPWAGYADAIESLRDPWDRWDGTALDALALGRLR